MLSGVDVVIPRMQRVGRPEMETGNFRLVQQWGAGLEGVDLEAAREKGISVANVPANGANAESVAEHGILLALALLRDLPTAQTTVRKGILGSPTGKMLAGRTVCLYGLGAVCSEMLRLEAMILFELPLATPRSTSSSRGRRDGREDARQIGRFRSAAAAEDSDQRSGAYARDYGVALGGDRDARARSRDRDNLREEASSIE